MSGILARIKIKHVQGAEIAYLYEKEILEQIGLLPDSYETSVTFFNEGDVFQLGKDRYRVVKIYTKFYDQIHEPDNYGIDLYGIGKHQPFNFQITYEVENE